MSRSGVRPSVSSIIRRPLGLLLSAVRAGYVDRQRLASSSKCGQCPVDSRVDEAENGLVCIALAALRERPRITKHSFF